MKANRYAVWFIFATVLIDMIGIGLVWPVLPKLIETISGRDLAGASKLAGWLYVAYAGMQFLCGPAIGNLSDAVGRRPVLLVSVAGLGIDYLITGLAPNMLWLFAGRVIAGVCGASYVPANAYLTDITPPEDRARAFGLIGAAFGLGFVIGPAIGGLIGAFGPRVPFFAAAGLALGNFIFGFVVMPETLKVENRRRFILARVSPIASLKVFSQYRGVLPMAIGMFFYFAASAVHPTVWAFWGIARFGWNAATIGLTLSAFGLLTAATQGLLTGPVVKAVGERRAMILGMVSATVVAAAYGIAPNLQWVLVLLVLHTPDGFVSPTMTAIMSHRAPADAQGELQGGIASLQSLGMLLGTLYFAQVFGFFLRPEAPVTSPNIAFFVAAGMLAMTFVFLVAVTRPQPIRP